MIIPLKRSDVFVYEQPLPNKIKGMTVTCPDGYTVYLNSNLSAEARLEAYWHELHHIDNGDYDGIHAGIIEVRAHGE